MQLCDRYTLRSIRRSVSQPVLLSSLVTSLVLQSRLDYGRVNLIGISRRVQDRLQSVFNAAARLVCNGRKYDHVTPPLRELHWLRIPERIAFRLAVLVFRCRNSTAPEYLARDCSGQLTMPHVSATPICVESQTGRPALQTENSRRSSRRRGCTSSLDSGMTCLLTSPLHSFH